MQTTITMNQFNAHPLPKKILIVSLCFATLTQVTCVFSTTKTHLGNHQVLTTQEVALNPANLSAIDSIVQSEIDAKHIPGAAIVIGQKITYFTCHSGRLRAAHPSSKNLASQ